MPVNHPCRVALVAAALSLAACAPGTPPESTPSEVAKTSAIESTPAATPSAAPASDTATTLTAYQWQLTSATDSAGQTMPAFFPSQDKPLGLLVADGRLNATGSCNRISAGYELRDGGQMQLSPGMSTMMACPPPLAAADAAMGKFLSGTLQASIAGETGAPQLRLAAADGSALTFRGNAHARNTFRRSRHSRVSRSFDAALPRACGPAVPDGARPPVRRERSRQRITRPVARAARGHRRLHTRRWRTTRGARQALRAGGGGRQPTDGTFRVRHDHRDTDGSMSDGSAPCRPSAVRKSW